MNKQRASGGTEKAQAVSTDFDDWETDPDYIRDIDEIEQRWGTRRTVGSINMNELIDQVNKEHKTMREKFHHPSQKLDGFTKERIIQTSRDPATHGYEESMSKHSSTQEISRKVYTSGSESGIRTGSTSPGGGTYYTTTYRTNLDKPAIATKPKFSRPNISSPSSPLKTSTFETTEPKRFVSSSREYLDQKETPNSSLKGSSTTRRIVKEEKSSSSSRDNLDSMPQAFKTFQDKIDAFRKEIEDLENKATHKSDLSKVYKKMTNYEATKKSSSDLSYESGPKNGAGHLSAKTADLNGDSKIFKTAMPSYERAPKSFTTFRENMPKTDIKGLSKRFETLCRETDEDFKRRTEAKRKEFFDQIKDQVRETRRNLDAFDTVEDGAFEVGSGLGRQPRVYTKCETTKEEIVSKVVKENDKIIENETKRNVERSSSCHGSSDEEKDEEPTSIKYLSQHLSKSPTEQSRTRSPIDDIKKKNPVVETEVKGAGLMARTLYDYQATEDDELSFDVDDLITNIDKVTKEWHKGTLTKNGRKVIGLFPANYVKLLNDSSEY